MEEKKLIDILKDYQDKIPYLLKIGILSSFDNRCREYNVGKSDYADKMIQPYSIWMDWHLDPWDADIIKRIARHKEGEDKKTMYKKIIHICEEKLRQLKYDEDKGEGKDLCRKETSDKAYQET